VHPVDASNSAARDAEIASPPVNITRSDDRSSPSWASSSITNWDDTAARTVTRSRSIACRADRGSNTDCTTHVAPSIVGLTCDVHNPNPKGAGTKLIHTSSARSSPKSIATWWK
jgi:hypothetical protein